MARTKKMNSVKSYVRLRTKNRAGGVQTLYLDIYKDGKRKYEYLTDANGNPMRLLPETGDPATAKVIREHNANVWAKAQAIQAERNQVVIAQQSLEGIGDNKFDKLPVAELCNIFAKYRDDKGLSHGGGRVIGMAKRLLAYKPNAVLKDIDKNFACGFADYLRRAKGRNGKTLAQSTIAQHFTGFAMMMNFAVKHDYMNKNPLAKMESSDKPKPGESTREYLTVDEVKALISTPCNHEEVKQAFLFSCFCGLRISDVELLTWGDLHKDGDEVTARIIVKKTKRQLTLPLSPEARAFMPEREGAKDSDHVFSLPTQVTIAKTLYKWAEAAGIKKRVTFHVARHTFATLGLTAGQDIAVISKLLGHKKIVTTQIYAKIIDEKKTEAMNAISALFG